MSIYGNIKNVDNDLLNDVKNDFINPRSMPWNNVVYHTVHAQNIRIDNVLIDGNKNIINFSHLIEENKTMKNDILNLKKDIEFLKNRINCLVNIQE